MKKEERPYQVLQCPSKLRFQRKVTAHMIEERVQSTYEKERVCVSKANARPLWKRDKVDTV